MRQFILGLAVTLVISMSVPANDLCVNAAVISSLPFTDTLDTTSATTSGDDPVAAAATSGHTVFYKWTAPWTGRVDVNTIGSDYDTVLSVWTGSCGALTEVIDPTGWSDDIDPGPNFLSQSKVTFTATAGVTYTIMAGAYHTTAGGTLILNMWGDVAGSPVLRQTKVAGSTPFNAFDNLGNHWLLADAGTHGTGSGGTLPEVTVEAFFTYNSVGGSLTQFGTAFDADVLPGSLIVAVFFLGNPIGSLDSVLLEFTGVSRVFPPAPFRVGGGEGGAAGTSHVHSTAAQTQAIAGLWIAADIRQNAISASTPTGFTSISDTTVVAGSNTIGRRIFYRVTSAPETTDAPYTTVSAEQAAGILLSFRVGLAPVAAPGPAFVPFPSIALVPQAPCAPQSQVSGGGKGKSGCNPGGVGWVSSYAGPYGTVPAHADPTDGETLSGKPGLDVWMDLVHIDYPSDVPTTYRRALAELGDLSTYEGGRKPAGLLAIGSVDHGLSNEQDSFAASSTLIKFADANDRFIRDLADSQDLEYDEVRIKLASPAARAAGTAPRIICRGVVQTPVLNSYLEADVNVVDPIFADFGPAGPNRTWPGTIPQLVGFQTPADVLSEALPWLYGEKSDEGATDPATGTVVSKGLIPLHYLGQESISRTAAPSTAPPFDPTIVTPITAAGVVGTSGSGWSGPINTDPIFFFAPIAANGSIGQVLGPYKSSNFDPTPHEFEPVFNAPSGSVAVSYILWMADDYVGWTPDTNPFVSANARYQIIPADPQASIFMDWNYSVHASGPTDWSAWPPPLGDPQTVTELWDAYLVEGHPIFEIIRPYGSDLGSGDPTKQHDRMALDPDTRSDILVPGFANWPFAQTYREYIGADGKTYWFTVIYAKGPLSDDHKNGVVTMAVNAIGVEDVGDGTGLPLIDAHACQQHWLENPIIGPNRIPWTSGPWANGTTYPKWEDGTPMVRSSSFSARQTFTATALPTRGLTIGWAVDTTQQLGAWFKLWNRSTETRLGINGHGQILIWGLDEMADPTAWPSLDHVVDIFGKVQSISGQERENAVTGSFDWDPDASRFRNAPVTYTSPAGIQKYKGHQKQGDALDTTILNDATQFAWVLQRRLTRLQFGSKQVQIDGPIGYLDYDVGTGILLTTIEGTGTVGYLSRPFIILWRSLNIATRIVTYTLLDVNALLFATSITDGLSHLWIAANDSTAPIADNDLTVAPVATL